MTNPEQVVAESPPQRKRTQASVLLRVAGLLIATVITVLFGLIPFLLGFMAQALSPRRIPAFVVGPLAAVAFFAIWHFTGWMPITVGEGKFVWASAFLSLILFVAFFASGTAFFRQVFPRRFALSSPVAP